MSYHYATQDAHIVGRFIEWRVKREVVSDRATTLAGRVGREIATSQGPWGFTFTCFTRKKGEPTERSAYAKTMWVLTDSGFLRPRSTHKEGRQLQAELDDLNKDPTLKHPADIVLVGIPKIEGLLGRPGMMLTKDEKTLIVTYGGRVKHDSRWEPLPQSAYWSHREAHEVVA